MNGPPGNLKSWLRVLDNLSDSIDDRRAELRWLIQEQESGRSPKSFRTLPYGHPLGPTGEPKTFGACGGGNRSGTAQPGAYTYGQAAANERLPSAYWDFSFAEQTRQFDNLNRQYSRIKKNGGVRKPAHRPRSITPEQEQRVRDLLAADVGVKKAAKVVGIGVSGVQRIKREGVPQVVRLT